MKPQRALVWLHAKRNDTLAEIGRMQSAYYVRDDAMSATEASQFVGLLERLAAVDVLIGREQHTLKVNRRRQSAVQASALVGSSPDFVCQCATCLGKPYVEELPTLPLPVMPLREGGAVRYLADEIERRGRTIEQWGPWGALNKRRRSRRYEGFPRGQRW